MKDSSTELAALAARSTCPYCQHVGLEFVLRCDLGYGQCLYTARCAGCGVSMEILVSQHHMDTATAKEAAGPCPDCGSSERIASLQCSESAFACVYHVRCAGCEGENR